MWGRNVSRVFLWDLKGWEEPELQQPVLSHLTRFFPGFLRGAGFMKWPAPPSLSEGLYRQLDSHWQP